MKKYIIKLFFINSLLIIGCQDFLDVNENPGAPLSAPAAQLLTAAQTQLAFNMGTDILRFSLLFSQQFTGQGGAGSQNRDYERYAVRPGDVDQLFRNGFYAGVLPDLEAVIRQTEGNSPRIGGIAKVLKAHAFSVLVDAFGDVPFAEALKGSGVPIPVYDDDSRIYPELLTLLDAGINDLKATTGLTAGNADLIYGGNTERWERFANTLKLRLLLHYSLLDGGVFARTEITKLISGGARFMASNADNFQLVFENTPNKTNPLHQYELQRESQFFPCVTLVNLMNAKDDPRRVSFFTTFPFNRGTYTGSPLGNNAVSFAYSRMHTYLRGDSTGFNTAGWNQTAGTLTATAISYTGTAPVRMLTFSEYNFIRAEAALQLNAAGDAAEFFREGIQASMNAARVPTAQAAAYLAAQTSGSLTLQKIIEEKYVSNYGIALEPWTDWRRTGFPILAPVPGAFLNAPPRVLPYSQLERDVNPTTPKRENMLDGRVFWDIR